MKNYLLLFFIIFNINVLHSQSIQQIDSISKRMCESISGLKEYKDDVKITMLFQKHLPIFFLNLNISSQSMADSISTRIYYRLQKNCDSFRNILTELEINKSDWIKIDEKPKSIVSSKDFAKFVKQSKFYYKEYNGKIVNVIISENIWTETFEDNTTSILEFKKKSDYEFELIFIKSTNSMRSNLSIKGDKYNYGIYKIDNGVYSVWILNNDKTYSGFKLYERG